MTDNKQAAIAAIINEGKDFGFYELLGLKKAFEAIEVSNPKRPAKVDYWLSKNHKIVGDAFNNYLYKESDLIKQYAETFTHPDLCDKKKVPVVFIVYKGKDDEDTLINDSGAFFQLSYKDEKPVLDFVSSPSWDLEIPGEGDAQPTVQKMKYAIKFKSEQDTEDFNVAIQELQNTFSEQLTLWKLDETHLEGLNIMWKGRNEDLTEFRTLIYENAING